MNSISKSMHINKLDLVHKYNNTHHRTIKRKPVDVKSNTYIDSSKEINDKDPKFKIGDIVRISKYKNIFLQKTIFQIGLKFLSLNKLKTLCPGYMLLAILKAKESLKHFRKKNCKKTNKKSLELIVT